MKITRKQFVTALLLYSGFAAWGSQVEVETVQTEIIENLGLRAVRYGSRTVSVAKPVLLGSELPMSDAIGTECTLTYRRHAISGTNWDKNQFSLKLYAGETLVADCYESYNSDYRAGDDQFKDIMAPVTVYEPELLAPGELTMQVTATAGDYLNQIDWVKVGVTWRVPKYHMRWGCNLSGYEWGNWSTGQPGIDYSCPTPGELDYYASFGMKLIRIPLMWERIISGEGEELNEAYLQPLDELVDHAENLGQTIVIDLHNYGRFEGAVITDSTLLADTWRQLAARYMNRPVWFSLMNEFMGDENIIVTAQNDAIEAIRDVGATNKVVIGGNAWSGAHSWNETWYGTPNAQLVLQINDPLDNTIIACHMYGDSNASGTSPEVVSETIGSERLADITAWARANGKQLYLEEFGFATNSQAMAALTNTLDFVTANKDVFAAATFWSGGSRWENYIFDISPDENFKPAPQLKLLAEYIDYEQPALRTEISTVELVIETNLIDQVKSVSWHYGYGRLPDYLYRTSYGLDIGMKATGTVSAIEINNGSQYNRITEIKILAWLPHEARYVEVFYGNEIPFGNARIEFQPVTSNFLWVYLLDSMNRATFEVNGVIASSTHEGVRITPEHAAYGQLIEMQRFTDLNEWTPVDSFVYGQKKHFDMPVESDIPAAYFRVLQHENEL